MARHASRVPLPLHATLVTSLRWPRSVATHAGAPPATLARAAALAAARVGVTPFAPPPAPRPASAVAAAAAATSMAFCSAALQLAVTRKTCSTESVVPTAKRVPPGLHAAW